MFRLCRWRAIPAFLVLLAVTSGVFSAVTREEFAAPLEKYLRHFWQIEDDDSDEADPAGASLLKKKFEIVVVPVRIEAVPAPPAGDARLFAPELRQLARAGIARDIFVPPETRSHPA